MTRQYLSDIVDRPIRLLNAGDDKNLEVRDLDSDELLAIVAMDDLFNGDGNQFEMDLD